MARKKTDKEEFGKYTSHDYWNDKVTPYVTLWVKTSEYTVRERNENDEWDAGDSAEELTDYGVCIGANTSKSSYLSRDKALNENHIGFFPKVNDPVYMVIESYGTGSTFGSTNPVYRPVKIFKTRQDAEAWLLTPEAERCKDTDYFGGHNEYIVEKVWTE